MLPMTQLIFKYGAMSCGKSMQLIALAHQYSSQNKKIMVMKPAVDTRTTKFISSRTEMTVKADLLINESTCLLDIEGIETCDCILVDEAQFLDGNIIEQFRELVTHKHVRVICFGLLLDFRARLFDGSKRLTELADICEEISTVCHYCNNFAKFNMRHENGIPVFHGQTIQIGSDESYHQVCWNCYDNASKKNF